MWEACRTAHGRHTVKINVDGNQSLHLSPRNTAASAGSSVWPGVSRTGAEAQRTPSPERPVGCRLETTGLTLL